MIVGIFGGMGYIGSRLVSKLAKDHTVMIADKLMYDVSDEFFSLLDSSPNIQLYNFDILDYEKTKQFIDKCDKIVNLSAYVGETICQSDKNLAVGTNRDGAKSISDYCKKTNKHLVFLSTCSNYGTATVVCNEDSKLNPLTLYAKTKVDAENHIIKTNKLCTVLRVSTIFGVSDSRTRMDIIPNQFVKQALVEGSIEIYEPDAYRPIIHVDDATEIIKKFLISDPPKHQVYNVGFSSMNLTKGEMIQYIKSVIPCEVLLVNSNDTRSYKVDFSRLHKEFDLVQHYSLERGVDEVKDAIDNAGLDLGCGNYAK